MLAECAQWALSLPDSEPGVYAGMTRAQGLGRKRELAAP
jgi:hypothetical protein